MNKKLYFLSLCMAVMLPTLMVQAVIQEDFEDQVPPATNAPPTGWVFLNVEDQNNTYYEAVVDGDNAVGRVKADVVVNGFYAAGYIANTTGVSSSLGFSGSFDILVEDEGGWSDGLFMLGDILNGHTDDYYTLKYQRTYTVRMFESDYPADSRIEAVDTGIKTDFNVWYSTTFAWAPGVVDEPNEVDVDPNAPVAAGVAGTLSFEIADANGAVLVASSAQIALPEIVYFGFGSSNDAIQVDNVVIEADAGAYPVEDFETQVPPATDMPPAAWSFVNVEDQNDTYYEAVIDGNDVTGRVKCDKVVNGFYAAGYLVSQFGIDANLGISASFEFLVEDEGGWSDGLILLGDIANGHTENYYTIKLQNKGDYNIEMYDSDYPADSRIQVVDTGIGAAFNTWYTVTVDWAPGPIDVDPNALDVDPNAVVVDEGVTGTLSFEILESDGTLLVSSSAQIRLPDVVHIGFGSANDAIRVDNIAIQSYLQPEAKP